MNLDTDATPRARRALPWATSPLWLTLALVTLVLVVAATEARADDPAPPDPAAGTVNQLGADPMIRVARSARCVHRRATFRPSYWGGGGLVVTYLFLNGNQAAVRRSQGAIRISARRLQRGPNRYELISEFADGRAASVTGTLRRCHGG